MTTQWEIALVTGASSGIGEQFCRLLAAGGTDLVVVARDEKRLRDLADDLTGSHGIGVEVLPADLTNPVDLARVTSRLDKTHHRVDLLVNNAGLGFTGNFIDVAISKHREQLAVNIDALVELSYSAAGSMALAKHGTILNVSSVAGDIAGPKSAIYNATKSFVTSFSQSLSIEMANSGVTVSCLCPGLTRTQFQGRAGYDASDIPKLLWQSAEEVAQAGLDAAAAAKPVVISGVINKTWSRLMRSAPRSVGRSAARIINRK